MCLRRILQRNDISSLQININVVIYPLTVFLNIQVLRSNNSTEISVLSN